MLLPNSRGIRWCVVCAATVLVWALPVQSATRLFGDGFERSVITGCTDHTPPVPAGLTLSSPFADPAEVETRTRGIWAIWWYPQFDHAADAEVIFDRLENLRCNAIQYLGMRDPPNPGRGVFYNIYIHHGADDAFPVEWGNGQGTDIDGNPFLTLPAGYLLVDANLDHEGFHVFQFSSDSPGFAYTGDSGWYSEASAQWYMSTQSPLGVETFVQIGTIEANPQLAVWHGWSNAAPGDPTDWNYTVRQYGMHSFLHYLVVEAGIPDRWLVEGFYGGVTQLPQAYLHQRVGAAALRRIFADWAAANTAGFDYLTPAQVVRARQEIDTYGDPATMHHRVAEHGASGTDGALLRPPELLAPRGWAYNVIHVQNPIATDYEFELVGDAQGSETTPSIFAARVVSRGTSGVARAELDMVSPTTGTAWFTVPADTEDLYLVVVAMPEHFTGNQRYGYQYRISPDLP